MTEKRFTTESVFIRDNQTQIVMECSCSEDADNIAEHLNVLYEENIRLRRALQIELDKELPSAPVGHCRCTTEPYRCDGND